MQATNTQGAAASGGRPSTRTDSTLLSRIRGCLVGGAAGDALGYPVEFDSYEAIIARYGVDGIWNYSISDSHGRALFSDDTQMTLFTAVGLLEWGTKPLQAESTPTYAIYRAYLDWLATQDVPGPVAPHVSWLATAPALHASRAPGNTCLSALSSGRAGRIGNSLNSSKGCGGVMRVAPIGLFGTSVANTVRWAAEAAALTHGHPLGYIPAGALAYLVRECAFGPAVERNGAQQRLLSVLDDCIQQLPDWFPEQQEKAQAMVDALVMARDLARADGRDIDNIARLGGGWVGDEALAIAVYCALRHAHSFDGALIAAVNHDGDSDSTGAITGNILGALLGMEAIGPQWTRDLELYELLLEVADSLHEGRVPSQERLARDFAQRVHAGQLDKAGQPYLYHPATVASRVQGDDVRAAAWLHDTVEDTPTTLDDLQMLGLSEEVVAAVSVLTRREGEDYLGFVHRTACNDIARQVKLADVVHNMDLSRLPAVDAAAVARVREKYVPALEILIGTRVTVKS